MSCAAASRASSGRSLAAGGARAAALAKPPAAAPATTIRPTPAEPGAVLAPAQRHLPLLRACLRFRRGLSVRAAAADAAADADGPPPPSLEAARLAAAAGLQRGLRTAAAAAAAADNASLEGRLLPAHLVAVPASENDKEPHRPAFLLRLLEQRFSIGNQQTITVVTPHDVDAIFDALQARGCEDGDPYWARVWPSAVALAECISQRPELVRGKRVADVGAGLGVAGLAAALAGAREVVLLDREPLALECARLSAEATGRGGAFEVARPAPDDAATSSVAVVAGGNDLRPLTSIDEVLGMSAADGGNDAPTPTTPTPKTLVRAEPFDWAARPLPASLARRFDVVLACDVLYERDAVGPLAEVVPLLMSDSAPGGGARLLLADPPARTAENRERFLRLLAEAGGRRKSGRRRWVVDEAAMAQCAPRQLDRELLGGEQEGKPVPVQLLFLRAAEGDDTIGVKLDVVGGGGAF